jgi:uncharacterized protein involved in type VI secretion and phage assembly
VISCENGRPFDRRFFGVLEAIVEEVVDPDKEGRVKVRFPWYDEGTVTEWARVRQLYAGPGYGTFFVPEKGDEVLVAFVLGDMRKPIVLGGLYNTLDKPPSDRQADDEKDEKLIRTRRGHRLLLDDTRGKERVQVTTAGGHRVDLDDAGHRITVRTSGGQTLVLDGASGSITLSGAVRIDVGDDPGDRVVLGDKLMALFNGHTHSLPGGPTTGAPTSLMGGGELSDVVRVA